MKKHFVRFVRVSPATVVAMAALFVALTGTAVATTSALITGNQIKNSSITGADIKNKSLRPIDFRGSVRGPRGLRGLTGATGAQGIQGVQGIQGIQGPPGPFPATLPAGQTLKGAFYVLGQATAAGGWASDSASFLYPLAEAPTTHYIKVGDPPVAVCPGNASDPQAQAGHMCAYEVGASNVTTSRGFDTVTKYGVGFYTTSAALGNTIVYGRWAVTGGGGAAASVSSNTAAPSQQ